MKKSAARNNIIRAVAVVAVLALLLFPARYSNKIYAYFPFFAVLLLVLLSVFATLRIRRGIRFDSDYSDTECERGRSVPISLKIFNDSRFICPRAIAYLYISDLYGGTDTVTPSVFTMAAGGMSDFSFDIRMDHIGEYRAGIRSMELYDFLGLFRFPLGIQEDLVVTVMPRDVEEIPFELHDQSVSESMDQRNSSVSDGFDYSGVREYAIGDPIKRIHWKLSAHSTNYMTRLTETSTRNDVAMVIDSAAPAFDRETLACLFDKLVEGALSYLRYAVNMEEDYSLYFSGKDGTVHRMIPKSRADERDMVRRMAVIAPVTGAESLDGAELLRREAMISGGSSNVILFSAYLTEDLINELITIRQQGRNAHIVYVIPHDFDSRQREDAVRPLNALGEYDIGCSIMEADASEVS